MSSVMHSVPISVLFEATRLAIHRHNWAEAFQLADDLRRATPTKPHGYVWGANAATHLALTEDSERLFAEAMRLFPDDPWTAEERLWALQHRANWAATTAYAAEILKWENLPNKLHYKAVLAQFRAAKAVDEAAIGTDAILAAVRSFPTEQEVVTEVMDVCVQRRNFDLCQQVWRELQERIAGHEIVLASVTMRLFSVFHQHPDADQFVLWVFRGDGQKEWIFYGVRAIRYLTEASAVPRAAHDRLQAIYDSLNKSELDDYIRAALGSYFGDVLEQNAYEAVMLKMFPQWSSVEFDKNPMNNLFYFAGQDARRHPNSEIYGPRIRAAFTSVTDRLLSDRLAEPGREGELLFLLVVANLTEPDVYDKILKHIEQRTQPPADAGTDTAAGALRMILHERLSNPAPSIITRRPKVCIELAAHVRGYKRAFATWHHLGLDACETVVVAHLWNRVGRRVPWAVHEAYRTFQGHFLQAYSKVLSEHNWEYIKVQYPALVSAITDSDVLDKQGITELYNLTALETEEENDLQFRGKPQYWRMYYSWWKSHALALKHAPDADLYIRMRPDLYFKRDLGLDWVDFAQRADAENTILVQFPRRFLPTGGAIGCGDQIAIGAKRGITAYCSPFVDAQQALDRKLFGFPRFWEGHETVAFSTLYRDVKTVAHPNLPPENPLFDPPPLSPALILDCMDKDLQWRSPTTNDAFLLKALAHDLREK